VPRPVSSTLGLIIVSRMEEEIQKFIDEGLKEHKEKVFFIQQELGAEIHWFFTQAFQALKSELYLPACTSFLNGIEASLRVTMAQVEKPCRVTELDGIKTLSNSLLKSAKESGLPIEALAFPDEHDFLEKSCKAVSRQQTATLAQRR